ncbi:MAG: exopolysaccharide transport family protein [Hyphomicrobiaceae bacterium]
MRTTANASPDNINPATLLGTIAKSLPWLMAWTLFVMAATFGLLSLVAPRFQSEAQLTIDAKSATNPFNDPKQVSQGADSTASQMDREAINTHIKSLQSPTLAAEIVAKLKLRDKVEFNTELGDVDLLGKGLRMVGLGGARPGQSEQDRVLEAYFKNLDVYSAKESRFIGLRFTSTDPQLAADIPNALAEAYRDQLAGRKVEETKDVQDALLPKIEQLTKDVAAAEVAVEQFRGKSDSFATGAQKQTLNEQQLGELTNELSKAQAARSESEARARAAVEMARGGAGEVLPDVQRSPLIQNLVQQRVRAERQIAEVSASLLPGHPRMQQLNADLAGLKKQIASEVAKIVDGMGKEAKVNAERETAIKKRLSELKVTVVNAGPDEAKLKMFIADAKSKRDELERLQAQYNVNKTRAESKAVPVEAKVLSPAYPSSVAVFPKKGALTAVAALAAFVLGLAITVLKAVAKGARSTGTNGAPRQMKTRKGDMYGPIGGDAPALAGGPVFSNPVAAAVPVAAAAAIPASAAVVPAAGAMNPAVNSGSDVEAANVVAVASADALLAHLLERTPEKGGFRTLIAGESRDADATGIAIAVAKGLAHAGQPVMLVEWSYGNASVARQVGLDAAPGIAELISGAATFESVIACVPDTECHFIPPGENLADAAPAMDPDQLNLVLDALDEAYAHIVIVGEHDSVRHLFETIQGRCDAGVLVASGANPALRDPEGTFLGFEVADIEIIRLETATAPRDLVQRRLRGLGAGGDARVPV